jgi:regulator of sigma E protease
VRMLDERDGEVPPEDRPRAFTSKPPWQRILVLLAGPAANIVFAIVVLSVMIWVKGIQQYQPVIGGIVLGKPAAEAGLRDRDLVLSVNGSSVTDQGQLQFKLLDAVSSGQPVVLRVRGAGGAERVVSMPLADKDQRFELTKPRKLMPGLGMDYWYPPSPAKVSKVLAGGPAELAGIKAGDLVVAIDGQPMPDTRDVMRYISERPGQDMQVRVRRGDGEHTVPVVSAREVEDGKAVGRLKFEITNAVIKEYPSEYVTKVSPGPLEALAAGTSKAWEMTAAQATFFWRMITRKISTDNLTSLITIADYAGQTASAGPTQFLTLLVLLSLSLGFFNLLPIPILDGGQIIFQAAEWIRGKPLSERVYMLGQQAGLVAIMLLMGVALFNDLSTYLFPGAGK